MVLANASSPVGCSLVDPRNLNYYLMDNKGYDRNVMIWDSFQAFGLFFESTTREIEDMIEEFCEGKILLLNGMKSSVWALAKSLDDNGFTVENPRYSTTKYFEFGSISNAAIYHYTKKSGENSF